MLITLTKSDLDNAPPDVRAWVMSQLTSLASVAQSLSAPSAVIESKPEPTPEPRTEVKPLPKVETIHIDRVVERAKAYLDKNGAPALKSVLASFGYKKVQDCPTDRLGDLFTELAISE